ncbi:MULTISPECIES: hypothetical protein [Methylobacterium]|jgi:hypothetical protein|uniref:hypothetical protein n=1 Tax=Methylobacterium TaxID=407 RepID=UPI0007C8702B|nr:MULTISPECIES: hypothetical protein [Methylobacterium]UHC20387.1 hypothetical protein LRS73_34675 [Methylobacterium currus]
MQVRAGERLRLTLSGAGCRAVVSLNTYAVTQAAVEGLDPSEDGFSYDVTPWLQPGRNVVTVVLIGLAAEHPFRLMAERGGQAQLLLDEAELLPVPAPWRLWTTTIELTSSVHPSIMAEERDLAWPSRTRDADLSDILVA